MKKKYQKTYNIEVLFILFVVICNCYLFFQNNENIYMGIPYSVVDTNTYLSFINQVSEGKLLFTNRFTSEKVPYIIFRPEFLLIGIFGYFLTPLLAYYFFKFVFLFLYIFLINKLIKLTVNINELNITKLFVYFGSGIGYLLILLNNLGFKRINSADYLFGVSNSISINILPVHFIMSVCLMISIIILYILFWKDKKIKYLIFSGLLSLILGFIHLFNVITIFCIFGFYMILKIINKNEKIINIIKFNLIFGLINLPALIYIFYLYTQIETLISWNKQNILTTPPIQTIILGFFIPLGFAILYLIHKIVNKKNISDFEYILYFWITATFILIYMPFNIQSRFLEGVNIPIMIIGALGFSKCIDYLSEYIKWKKLKPISIILIFLLISPTSFLWLEKIITTSQFNNAHDTYIPLYLEKTELEAMNWLKENTDSEEIVISKYRIGNYIPRVSGNRVFFGHWAQTINFETKKKLVQNFYSNETQRNEIIENYNIKFIYFGNEERKIGIFIPTDKIKQVYKNKDVSIYKIQNI
ncbi:hypothetical protein HOC11_08005 [archaeon]|jgi:hypothetical protein|nr:hypothetical protein [archaeon]